MYERFYLERLVERISEPRRFIQVIYGPRQVGKTTMVHQMLSKLPVAGHYESADAIEAGSGIWLEQIWEGARLRMQVLGVEELLLVIDDSKIKNWSEVVKQQWDRDTQNNVNIKVVLLGSSQLLIQRGLTESLAGRFETLYMGHWSFTEMQQAFGWSVKEYIYFGGYPGATPLIEDEKRWKNYITDSLIQTTITKDILMMTSILKPALLQRLFELGCIYSGQILSYTKMLGQLQDAGNTTTLAHYLSLLSNGGLLTGIEKYAGNRIRKRASSPKFQVHNNALISAQGGEGFENVVQNPKLWGRMVESSVGAHLINHSVSEGYNLYYWREGNAEVDFILEKGRKVVAIEVKSSAKSDAKSGTAGMEAFAKAHTPNKALLVGTGGIPYEEFLQINPNELF